MKKFFNSLILILWGGVVLWLSYTGRLSVFLHPSFQTFSTISGFVLLLLGLIGLRGWFEERQKARHHHHSHDHDCGHDHSHDHDVGMQKTVGSWVRWTILVVPLLAAATFAPTGYSISTVENRGVVQSLDNLPAAKDQMSQKATDMATPSAGETSSVAKNSSSGSATTKGGAIPAQLIDLLYAVQMPSYREEFENRPIEMIGQFVPLRTDNPHGDRFQIVRMFITCCAADAKPVAITVQSKTPIKAADMSWLKITGLATFPVEGGRRVPLLKASEVIACPAPDEPFVY